MIDWMRRGTRQKVVAGAAVAVLAAGGAIAAVSATGQSSANKQRVAAGRARDLATAAAYLGTSTSALSSELRSGKTLAQIATDDGKSTDGLIAALEASKRARLAKTASRLSTRVNNEVNRPGGPVGGPESAAERLRLLFATPRHLGEAAASYLGTSAAALEAELRSGKTLAQIAEATAGKSTAGLIDALVAAEQRTPLNIRTAARLSAKRRALREQRVTRHATRLTQRKFVAAGSS
jgi:hypothetical protein